AIEQRESKECGCISAILMMVPVASMKATVSGMEVSFIQKQYWGATGNTNSIPWLGASDSLNFRPFWRLGSSAATSTVMRCEPICNGMRGNCAMLSTSMVSVRSVDLAEGPDAMATFAAPKRPKQKKTGLHSPEHKRVPNII